MSAMKNLALFVLLMVLVTAVMGMAPAQRVDAATVVPPPPTPVPVSWGGKAIPASPVFTDGAVVDCGCGPRPTETPIETPTEAETPIETPTEAETPSETATEIPTLPPPTTPTPPTVTPTPTPPSTETPWIPPVIAPPNVLIPVTGGLQAADSSLKVVMELGKSVFPGQVAMRTLLVELPESGDILPDLFTVVAGTYHGSTVFFAHHINLSGVNDYVVGDVLKTPLGEFEIESIANNVPKDQSMASIRPGGFYLITCIDDSSTANIVFKLRPRILG